MISEKLSNKFRICSLLATFFVVYRHSFVIQAFYGKAECDAPLLVFFTHWISTLTEVAVPIFFMISGFFFLGKKYNSWSKYCSMIFKKGRTLFVPFVFWNIMGLIVLLIYKSSEIPHDLFPFLRQFFLSDYYGPLWYVRDIMLYMLLIPLYQWILNRPTRLLLGVLVGYLFWKWIPVDCSVFSSEGIFFFIIGGIMRTYHILDFRLKSNCGILLMTLIWQLCCMFCDVWGNVWIHKTITLLGIVSLWCVLDLIPLRYNAKLIKMSSYAFFIYVTHFYSVKIVKIIFAHYFYGNEYVALLTFLLVPLFVVACLFGIGSLYKHYLPSLYFFTTGNR